MEGWEIIQDAHSGDGTYDQKRVLTGLSEMNKLDFNRFCRQFLHLMHYYGTSRGASVCDLTNFIRQHPGKFWKLDKIDFDQPVNFIRID